jgi:hypothetical protein
MQATNVMLPSPHFSQAFYCGGGSGHVYCVALRRAPRRTVECACGALGRAPCIHARLRRLATKPCEKSGLAGPRIGSSYAMASIIAFSVGLGRIALVVLARSG